MSKRYHASSAPTYSFTPGIVERGQTMTVGRRTFITPDPEPRPQGRRSLQAGRKVYTWSVIPLDQQGILRDGRVSDRLKDEDDGSAPMPVRLSDGTMGYVSAESGHWQVERTVDMGDAPIPTMWRKQVDKTSRAAERAERAAAPKAKPARDRKAVPSASGIGKARTQTTRKTPAASPRQDNDRAVRTYLKTQGLGNVVITPKIRALALDAIAAQVQDASYLEKVPA